MKPPIANSVVLSALAPITLPAAAAAVFPFPTRTPASLANVAPNKFKRKLPITASSSSEISKASKTVQGINHALHNLYALLAQNRISPRRAAGPAVLLP